MFKRFQTKFILLFGLLFTVNIILYCIVDFFGIEGISLSGHKIFFGSVCILLTMGLIAAFLWNWINIPLKLLSKSFIEENPDLIQDLKSDSTEIGRLASLVSEFFQQKQKLEGEILERIQIEEQLLQVREQLELMVNERTKELTDSNLQLRKEIEEKKKVEASLEEFQTRLSFMAETTGDVLYRLKYESMEYDYLNPAIKILTGYSHTEINEIGFSNIILKKELHDLPHNQTYIDMKIIEIERCVTEYSSDYLIRRKDGQTIWVSDHSFPWRNERGEVIGSVGVLQDISKRKTSELIIKRQDAILRSISSEAEIFLKTTNWEERICEALNGFAQAAEVCGAYIFKQNRNASDEITFQYKPEWCVNFSDGLLNDYIPSDFSTDHPVIRKYYKSLKQNLALTSCVNDLEADEKKFFESIGVKSILFLPVLAGKEIWGFISFFDSSQERSWSPGEIDALRTAADILSAAIQKSVFEQELVRAKEKAEKSDQLKTDFLTQMSHEIRTPLNSIINYTSLVRDEVESKSFDTLPYFFDVISEAGKRLTRTIDLILNMSQLQTGSYEPNFRIIDLGKEILNQLADEYSLHAAKKGLEFNYSVNTSDIKIKADSYTVSQIFDNIINNAVKYTSSGKVDVTVYSQNGSVCINVADTGIGILKEYLPNLFMPFSQEEMGYSRRFDGNGLGLALVKKYIELNHGEISVESEKGKGSTFTIRFNRLSSSEVKN